MKHHPHLLLVLAFACSLPGCSESNDTSARTLPIEVVAANYPLAFFATQIGGPHVTVTMPVPDGVDPAEWLPTPEDIGAIQQAGVILLNGAGYSEWAKSASLPTSRTWTTSTNARDNWIQVPDGAAHSHGPGGEHTHMKTASVTWLDPDIAMAQAESVRDALISVAPEYQELFGSNCRILHRRIIEASADVEQAINTHPDRPVIFSTPKYHYLARRFRMNGESVDWDPGRMPADTQFLELQRDLQGHPAAWMIWERTPDPEIVQRLQTLGISSVVYPSCATAPESGDFIDALGQGAAAMRTVYDAEEPG